MTTAPLRRENAVCTLLMKNDSYLVGALTLALSLKTYEKERKEYDVVLMVTDDISFTPTQNGLIAQLFDYIIKVPYIRHKVTPMRTEKQRQIYDPWMEVSFTQFQILKYMQGWKKVLFLDADTLTVRPINDLFKLNAPAATFGKVYSRNVLSPGLPTYYHPDMKTGDTIDNERIVLSLQYGSVCGGGVMLLEPSEQAYQLLLAELKRKDQTSSRDSSQNIMEEEKKEGSDDEKEGEYGWGGYSAINEQAICAVYLQLGQNWTQIGAEYQVVPSYTYMYPDVTRPYIFHFIGGKPWQHINYTNSSFHDISIWWTYGRAIATALGITKNQPSDQTICGWCQLIKREESAYRSHVIYQCPVIAGMIQVENLARPNNWVETVHQALPLSVSLPSLSLQETQQIYVTCPYRIAARSLNWALKTIGKKLSVYIRSPGTSALAVVARNHPQVSNVSLDEKRLSDIAKKELALPSGSPGFSTEKKSELIIIDQYTNNDFIEMRKTGDLVVIKEQASTNAVLIITGPEIAEWKDIADWKMFSVDITGQCIAILWVNTERVSGEEKFIYPSIKEDVEPWIVKKNDGVIKEVKRMGRDEEGGSRGRNMIDVPIDEYTVLLRDRLNTVFQSDYFNMTQEEAKKLLIDMKPWINAFTHETADPINNLELFEPRGDKVADKYLLEGMHAAGFRESSYMANAKDTYMSAPAQNGYINDMGLMYLARSRGPSIDDENFGSDVFESMLGTLEDLSNKNLGAERTIQIITTLTNKVIDFKNLDMTRLKTGNDKSYMLELFRALQFGRSGPRVRDKPEVKLFQRGDAKSGYEASVYWNEQPIRWEQGLDLPQIKRTLSYVKAPKESVAIKNAWKEARDYMDSLKINTIILKKYTSGRSSAAEDLKQLILTYVKSKGFDDYRDIIDPKSPKQETAVVTIFLYGIKGGDSQLIGSAKMTKEPGESWGFVLPKKRDEALRQLIKY